MAKSCVCVCAHISSYIHLGYACLKQNVSLHKNYNFKFNIHVHMQR